MDTTLTLLKIQKELNLIEIYSSLNLLENFDCRFQRNNQQVLGLESHIQQQRTSAVCTTNENTAFENHQKMVRQTI